MGIIHHLYCVSKHIPDRRDGRAAECTGLENRQGATLPGFKSLSLHHIISLNLIGAVAQSSKKFNFNEGLTELEALVQKLESGELDLDESLAIFEQGIKLSRQCKTALDTAKQKITTLSSEDNYGDNNGMGNESKTSK